MVTQAAWVRGLTSNFLKAPKVRKGQVPGLFTANLCGPQPLPWTRAQQAAYILEAGSQLKFFVLNSKFEWTKDIIAEAERRGESKSEQDGFHSKLSLLSGDQGINGWLTLVNDFSVEMAAKLDLCSWKGDEDEDSVDQKTVASALEDLKSKDAGKFLHDLGKALAACDWRSFASEELDSTEREFKAGLRGTGGYKLIRNRFLQQIAAATGPLSEAAANLLPAEDEVDV